METPIWRDFPKANWINPSGRPFTSDVGRVLYGLASVSLYVEPFAMESEMHVREMISTHPDVQGSAADALIKCIEECYACSQTCTSCADACLAEDMVAELRQCIRLNLDCADICLATGAMASRRTGSNVEVLQATIQACADACRVCAEECARHSEQHDHCRICADSCRSCESACRDALSQVH